MKNIENKIYGLMDKHHFSQYYKHNLPNRKGYYELVYKVSQISFVILSYSQNDIDLMLKNRVIRSFDVFYKEKKSYQFLKIHMKSYLCLYLRN